MPNKSQTTKQTTKPAETKRAEAAEGGVTDYARRAGDTAVTAVDLQFGAALTAADRVRELVQPWRERSAASEEIKNLQHQLRREVNKVERRGGTARRRLTQRVRRTRNRVERQVSERRRKAEERLHSARTQVAERVPLV